MRANHWIKIGSIGVLLSITALADHGGNKNNNGNKAGGNGAFESTVVGSVPQTTIGGVPSGGAPWIVAEGKASVSGSGKLEVEVQGLLLTTGAPPALVGTVGPVQMVAASLVCGGSGGAVAGSTDGVPLSPAGNAGIEATVTVPATCMAPVILVRVFNSSAAPGSQLGPFIALTGVNMAAGNGTGHDDEDGVHK
jgi:hypothetical protein